MEREGARDTAKSKELSYNKYLSFGNQNKLGWSFLTVIIATLILWRHLSCLSKIGIGRYMGGGARCIESVIIDEGFGSLDKTGSDDMIQELTSLGRHLERIILVSHQDEFANAFPDRYSFKLVDKASYVTLMEDD